MISPMFFSFVGAIFGSKGSRRKASARLFWASSFGQNTQKEALGDRNDFGVRRYSDTAQMR